MKVVIDTCVYIDFLNKSKYEEIFYERTMFRFLSPVVAMELRAGAQNHKDIAALDRLFATYSTAHRVVSLSANSFLKAGEVLQKLSKKYSGHSFSAMANDVLIALSAASIGATLVTSNKKDFEKIATCLNFNCHFLK